MSEPLDDACIAGLTAARPMFAVLRTPHLNRSAKFDLPMYRPESSCDSSVDARFARCTPAWRVQDLSPPSAAPTAR
jgi:hypothetical protein